MKNSNVNINLYKTFLEVYELKNISKTAKKMYISQSAVSQNIKSLENQLGVTLFKKSTKGIFPTNDAYLIYEDVKKAFNILFNCEDKININKGEHIGVINIGIQSFLFNSFLVDKMISYQKKYPMIRFNIINKSTTNMLQMLSDENVDFVLDCFPINNKNSSIIVEKIGSIENNFITSINDNREYLSEDKLKTDKLIFHTKDSNIYLEIKSHLNITDDYPIVFAGTTENVVNLVSKEIGIGNIMCNKDKIKMFSDKIKVINTNFNLPKTDFFICYKPSQLNLHVKDFINFILYYK